MSKTNWGTIALFIIAVVLTALMSGYIGWLAHDRLATVPRTADDVPVEMEDLFVTVCVANLDSVSRADCREWIQLAWDYNRRATIDCFSNVLDIPGYTDMDFLSCIVDTTE